MIHSLTDEPGASDPPAGKFPLGRVVATPGALSEIPETEMQEALTRHHHGDWDEVGDHDRQENERSLQVGLRLLSVYRTKAGTKFYIITEHDRSVTTVLLPAEF